MTLLPALVPTGMGDRILLTVNAPGTGHNGDTITSATHDVSAALGFTPSPQTFAGGVSTNPIPDPVVEFQASYDGGETWVDVLGIAPAGDEATSQAVDDGAGAVLYDMGAPFNVPLLYRCRNVGVLGGQTYVSAWSLVESI